LPELDDEFAKDLGEHGTLDELKAELSAEIIKELEEQAEQQIAEQLVAELVKANPVQAPRSLVERQSQVTVRELLRQAGRSEEAADRLPAEVRSSVDRDSELKVRAGLLMAQIAKTEGIKIGEAEITEALEELATQSGKNVAKLRAEYRETSKREMLMGMILEHKVLDIIQSKAKIEES
jgi:trigger factor